MSISTQSKVVAEFITPEDERWTSLLAEVEHDFYHLPEYVELEAQQGGREATAFYAECGDARFLVPLLLSALPEQLNAPEAWRDATTPYGYPCPLLSPAGDEDQLRIFLQAFRDAATEQNIVAAFLRLHTLLTLPRAPLEEYGQLVHHGQTVYFDLTASEDEAMSALCTNHRRDIKKLSSHGFTVKLNDWAQYDKFVEIYRATMTRLEASPMYFFEGDYFPRLREILGESMFLATVEAPDGAVAAGGLFIKTGDIVQYHLAGSSDEYFRRSPIKLMVHWMRRWAKEQGASYLHMGGGLGGREDSLFNFKAGFSAERADFHTFRMIPDTGKYDQLVENWRLAGGESIEGDGFFPLYRRPLNS